VGLTLIGAGVGAVAAPRRAAAPAAEFRVGAAADGHGRLAPRLGLAGRF
jgi:hypothetical protein